VGGGQRLELTDRLLMAAAGKQSVDPRLECAQLLLLKSGTLGAHEPPSLDVGQRLTAPQAERLVERFERRTGISAHQRVAAGGDEPLEARDVELVIMNAQDIARRTGLQSLLLARGTKRSAQLRQANLKVGGGAVRCEVGPQLIGQRVRSDEPVRAQQQQRQHSPGARAADR
jgi:hypothetical protein